MITAEFGEWLTEKLAPTEPSTLLGLDFGFGYPAPAASVVFGASRWEELALLLAKHLEQESAKARDVAESINERFGNASPFRTNASRNDPRFYLEHGVPYFRLTEQFAPQAISQWYIGSGAAVGLSTMTGLACLGRLVHRREAGRADFSVFPFEELKGRHVIVEIYPALYGSVETKVPKGHRHDAEKSARWLRKHCKGREVLSLPSIPKVDPVLLRKQALAEGWILGIGVPAKMV